MPMSRALSRECVYSSAYTERMVRALGPSSLYVGTSLFGMNRPEAGEGLSDRLGDLDC